MTKAFTSLLLMFLVIIGCEAMETVENTFKTLEDARKANIVGEEKWIPEFLPLTAVNIRERHNLDTNEVWLSFSFNYSAGIGDLKVSCKPITASGILFPRNPGNWWPQMLTQRFSQNQEKERRYEFYQCTNGGNVAVDSGKGEAYYWHSGRGM